MPALFTKGSPPRLTSTREAAPPAGFAWIALLQDLLGSPFSRAQAAKAAENAIDRYSIGGDGLLHFAGTQAADAAEDAIDKYSIGREQLLHGLDSPPPLPLVIQ